MNDVKLIALYLPQFHPIDENNSWWGKGFTEWTNVSSAKPVFPGHYQPHIPADLGFYDLRLAEVREEQARLAQNHGIHGFCYYYYYFNGKRLLNRPLDEILASGKPDFPFCICWANENWTRKWDGNNDDILIEQFHSTTDDLEFIRQLIPILKDPRYIRINKKLLLIIYRAELFPDISKTAGIWRDYVRNEIGEELYLCTVDNFVKDIDPLSIGFDGIVQFPWVASPDCLVDKKLFAELHDVDYHKIQDNWIVNYPSVINHLLNVQKPEYTLFRGVFPSWDNTPRRQNSSHIFINSSPELYKLFLKATIGLTIAEHAGDERLIFVNAWNEWAEGAHLEPDKKYGLRFLEATREALSEKNDYKSLMAEIKIRDTESRMVFNSFRNLYDQIASGEEKIRELTQLMKDQGIQYDDQIRGLTQKIEEKDYQIIKLGQLFEQKDILINEKEQYLQLKETQFQNKELQLQAKEQHLQDQITQTVLHKTRIQELEHQNFEYDSLLTEVNIRNNDLTTTLNQKEQVVDVLQSTLAAKESYITEKESVIRNLTVKMDGQAAMLLNNTEAIQRLETMNKSLIDSYSWKVTAPLRWIFPKILKLFYFFFPYGTKRWFLFKTVLKLAIHPTRIVHEIKIRRRGYVSGKIDNSNSLSGFLTDFDRSVPIIAVFVPFRFWPPVFGGGVRIMNVYTELSKHFNIHLIGMGGLGDPFFKEVINPRLTMYFVPNSHDYFDYQTVEEKKAKGHLHDILLTTKFELLPHLVQITQALADKSDIFISSHPYFVPLFEKYLKNKFIIYEAHNLDYNLKKTYFDDPGANEHIQYYLELVKSVEARACLISSLIFTVSEEEKKEISAFYKVQDRKMVVVPNCIDVYAQKYEYKRTATGDKKKLIFVGSAHGPNIEAVEYIVNHLASKTPQYTYIIIGNLINIYKDKIYPANVEFTGIISEKEKDNIFRTSDLAINPMFSGSGTNLKVLDYLATGIPLLSTSFGMRGLESLLPGIFLAEKENFIEQIDRIFSLDETFLSETTKKARLLVESNFDRSIAVKNLVKILEKKKFR